MKLGEPIVCEDGLTRWPRITKKVQKKLATEESIPKEIKNFDETFNKLSEQVTGVKLSFCLKGWNLKKIKLILTILENLAAYNIELDMFLLFAFSRIKKEPRIIWPSMLSSLKAIKKYQDWISSFASKKEAKRQLNPLTIEEILENNHKKYLHYASLGWSDKIIFRTKAREFHPFYLISTSSFVEEYENHPETLRVVQQDIESVVCMLEKDAHKARKFWEAARRIKCQTEKITSTSCFRARC